MEGICLPASMPLLDLRFTWFAMQRLYAVFIMHERPPVICRQPFLIYRKPQVCDLLSVILVRYGEFGSSFGATRCEYSSAIGGSHA